MTPQTKLLILLSSLFFFTASCDDIETGFAYDKNCDFSAFKTYSWVGRKDPEMNALDHQKIVTTIRSTLETKGLRTVDLDPDLYVTYFADNNEEVRVNIRRRGYSYASDWYWAGGLRLMAGGSGNEIRTFDQGSLIVDIYDSSSRELIWRGVAKGTVHEDPKKNESVVKKAIQKLFESYPPG